MNKELTEKQLHNRLDKYYKEHYGESSLDEWYVNPADNIWKFERYGKIITLVCDKQTGEIIEC